MSGDDTIQRRGQSLENQFFADVDAKLLTRLQTELTQAEAAQELGKLSGIQDPAVLSALVKSGVSPKTFPALRLFPLVAVAWADGLLESDERNTVMEAANKHGVGSATASGELLALWLQRQPSEELFAAGKGSPSRWFKSLAPMNREAVKSSILREVRAVAESSGGVLGWGAISRGENAVMNRIDQALTR